MIFVCEYLNFVGLSSLCLFLSRICVIAGNWNVTYMTSILCMCEEPEYHKYGRWGESRQTRCSVAGKGLARSGSPGRHGVVWPVKDLLDLCQEIKTELLRFICVLFDARVPDFMTWCQKWDRAIEWLEFFRPLD